MHPVQIRKYSLFAFNAMVQISLNKFINFRAKIKFFGNSFFLKAPITMQSKFIVIYTSLTLSVRHWPGKNAKPSFLLITLPININRKLNMLSTVLNITLVNIIHISLFLEHLKKTTFFASGINIEIILSLILLAERYNKMIGQFFVFHTPGSKRVGSNTGVFVLVKRMPYLTFFTISLEIAIQLVVSAVINHLDASLRVSRCGSQSVILFALMA